MSLPGFRTIMYGHAFFRLLLLNDRDFPNKINLCHNKKYDFAESYRVRYVCTNFTRT